MLTSNWKQKLTQTLRLTKEESITDTYNEIKEGTILNSYNIWIMVFAMLIACIGLNTNNTSAVIGAMLISPLMGPIVGFGFGLAMNSTTLKKLGVINWCIMTGVCLIASSIYFFLTPFQQSTNTVDGFTRATIFDILIALFGGMAGFIGIIKREGTKVIAGVAVATACMPPLCTAGFGIAHGNVVIALGGFYFYIINCLFIGLATFLLSRITGFHKRYTGSTTFTKTTKGLWLLFIIAMLVPASILVYKKYKTEKNGLVTITNEQQLLQLQQKVQQLDSALKELKGINGAK